MKFKGTIDTYAEYCCEECNEIIHNHLDCPVCKKEYAPSEQYHSLSDPYWRENGKIELECKCGAKFITDKYDWDDTIWEQI
jgi:hypothetical protein